MKRLYALSKYDFTHGGEVDITANYTVDNPRFRNPRGRVSIRGNGSEYQVYVHWFAIHGPAGKDIEEVLFAGSLHETCLFASELNNGEMRRMFGDIKESEITEFVDVPDDVADDVYKRTHSILDIKDYWERCERERDAGRRGRARGSD